MGELLKKNNKKNTDIYAPERELKQENKHNTETNFLHFHIKITNTIFQKKFRKINIIQKEISLTLISK